jgi:formylglycine-generating enzyme required for sulfatase activity
MKWVTRDFVHLDRVASPWLIQRFVDTQAQFIFVPWGQEDARPSDAIPLGMPGVELGSHDEQGTTFAKILRKYALDDPSLHHIATIVQAGVDHVLHHAKAGPDDRWAQIAIGLLAVSAHAVTIDWVTVGNPGNMADTTGNGAVSASFQIAKYECTNQQYAEFLNSIAATDIYELYNTSMANDVSSGITRSGVSGAYSYAVKANMGDKPVNLVSWFDAARMSNWLHNGAMGSSSTETGAYTLNGATSGNAVALNPGAQYYIPSRDQWYKAAFYKAGGTSAGYWSYATQSNSAPSVVSAGPTGIGSAGTAGNFANYNFGASWNGQTGNVTTVGTNGGPGAYGTHDMDGNVWEWNDMDATTGSQRGLRGGGWKNGYSGAYLSSADSLAIDPAGEGHDTGFRLAAAVPEPSACAMALAGLACGGYSLFRRRRGR